MNKPERGRGLLRLIDLAKNNNYTYNLVMHKHPDMDTFASAYLLKRIFNAYGVEARIVSLDNSDSFRKIKDRFRFKYTLIGTLGLKEVNEPAIFLDCLPYDTNTTDKFDNIIGIIDHHNVYDFKKWRDIEYVDIRPVGACTSILVGYSRDLDVIVNKDAATIAYMGIHIDTRGFLFNMSLKDVDSLGLIMGAVDSNVIKKIRNNSLSNGALLALRNSLYDLTFIKDVAVVFAGNNIIPGDLAIVSEMLLRSVVFRNVFIFSWYEKEKIFKFSVRTEELKAENLVLEFTSLFPKNIKTNAGGKQFEGGGQLFGEHLKKETIPIKFVEAVRRLE